MPRPEDEPPERAIADLTSGQLLAKVMISLLPRSTVAARATGAEDADEADAPAVPVVLDPACYHGTLLTAVSDRFADRVRLAGQEIQESAAEIAALNLRNDAHGVPYEIQAGDSLLDDQLAKYLGAAAAVVCEPPSTSHSGRRPNWPPIRAGNSASRRHVMASWPGCNIATRICARAAWLSWPYPPGPACRYLASTSGPALVRSGALRDVIALPRGMGSSPAPMCTSGSCNALTARSVMRPCVWST